ncbi:recombinase family protein [Insolitispirillum peregrinum]|uniref:Site-specific DNA recombinase n=1 Tax=Insolitispirillum peregrinum TaxID=80876 RepID=A0A1N7MFI3_9PROT|nr:recombinase family protein [Insolitispirillum peregrinum]SIS84808.1 Site-specific DNA recombinase [Insolitispirillum peregrinum]
MTSPTIRIAVYARYSSDIQSPTSVADQIAACRAFIERIFLTEAVEVTVFEDAALSGATMNQRAGIQSLIRHVQAEQIDVVVAEGIDRLSRSIADMAALFDLLVHSGTRLITIHEMEVSDLHVGMKGTMNKMFLKDLKARIRRGQAARTEQGLVMGPAPFGYRVVKVVGGEVVSGVKEIDPDEAEIVRHIYERFTSGNTLASIVSEMNERKIPRRRATKWLESMVRKILSGPIYKGEVIYQRTTKSRDPLTGKLHIQRVPRSDWVSSQNEQLRIVSDELWRDAQVRMVAGREKAVRPLKEIASHQRVLTDYVFCGACGAVKHVAHEGRYTCSGNRYYRSCKNARGTKEDAAREALFAALEKTVKRLPPLRPSVLQIYDADIRRRHDLDRRRAEVADRIDRLMQAIEDGVDVAAAVERIKALQLEQTKLAKTINFEQIPHIGTDLEIRDGLLLGLDRLRSEIEREPVREMLSILKPRIVMTPISGQYRGETISIEVSKEVDPWARLWVQLQKG